MPTTTVYIGRFSCLVGKSDIESFFEGYGRLLNIRIINRPATEYANAYAYVDFDDARLVFLTLIYINESLCTL